MVSCPDTSLNRSVLARNNKVYKTEAYKISNKKSSKKKIKNLIPVERSSGIAENRVKKQLPPFTDYTTNTELSKTNIKVENIAIVKEESVKPLLLNMEIKEPVFTASINPESQPDVSKSFADNPSIKVSDIGYQAPVPHIAVEKKSKREFRIQKRKNARDKLHQFFNVTKAYLPALGFAVAGFVCSLVGLIVFGIPLGILSVVFSGIALGRLKTNPNQAGKGMAIAGLVLGILDITLVALILTGM